MTNTLQPASQSMVELNRYANEPVGAGHGELVNLPAEFDPLAPYRWTIRWSLTSIDYFVDGQLLATATDHVPQGAMSADVDVWGPDSSWPEAYSASLQPVSTVQQNQSFMGLLSSVTVSQTTAGVDFNGDGGAVLQNWAWISQSGVPGWSVVD